MARIVMAMSGGVDSSVAAALLRRQGYDVVGVFMRHGEQEPAVCSADRESKSAVGSLPIVSPRLDHKQGCCTASDAEDARRVADSLDIPFYALNLSDEFGRIIEYFVAEYSAARTPNPCIVCNNWLKFGKLFDYADSVGAEFVATGHYAQLNDGDFPALCRGVDADKDQSYVLFGVARRYLPRMMLPVGGYRKSQIRELARDLGLRVADKRDSQEICFVSSGDHADFIRRRRSATCATGSASVDTAGDIVTTSGETVGSHPGIEGFTIGQRHGLGVAMGVPYFVTRIESDTRRIVIGRREELSRDKLTFGRSNWLVDEPAAPFRCLVQIRYNSPPTAATVESAAARRFLVRFDEPCYGVAPGQAAVCYDNDRVLGGGWIE